MNLTLLFRIDFLEISLTDVLDIVLMSLLIYQVIPNCKRQPGL